MLFIVFIGLLSQGKLEFLTNKISKPTTVDNIIKIDETKIKVEVAKTNEERSKGLSNRDFLDQDSGMLFVFGESSKPTFWMKDTKIALDIIWIKDDKVVLINKNVNPEPDVKDSDLKKYPAPSEIDYVLEVNAGFSDKHKITTGSTVQKLFDL